MAFQALKDTHVPERSTIENLTSDTEVFSCPKYIRSSSAFITETLRKGSDVVQMPNGDIVVREIKIVATKYSWSDTAEQMVKVSTEI